MAIYLLFELLPTPDWLDFMILAALSVPLMLGFDRALEIPDRMREARRVRSRKGLS